MVQNSIIKDIQDKTIGTLIEKTNNGVDINYLGYSAVNRNSIVKSGTDAHINRVLFWLSSKRDDYVRESFKGGILYDLLNIRCNDEELSSWEQTIKSKFNEEFSGELELVYLKLSSNPKQRKIIINRKGRSGIHFFLLKRINSIIKTEKVDNPKRDDKSI